MKTLDFLKFDFYMLIPGCACHLSPSAGIRKNLREAWTHLTSPPASDLAHRSCSSNNNHCAGEGISHMTGS